MDEISGSAGACVHMQMPKAVSGARHACAPLHMQQRTYNPHHMYSCACALLSSATARGTYGGLVGNKEPGRTPAEKGVR